MAKNQNNNDTGPDGLPVDKSPATFGNSDRDANATLREQNLAAAEEAEANLEFENQDNEDEQTTAKVTRGLPINPSSTYPGRDTELAEHDMKLPTEIDLAKRASFAGSQVPARVQAAGLADMSFDDEPAQENTQDTGESNS